MDIKLTFDQVKEHYAKNDFKFYEGAYNVNLYGIRSRDMITNMWNDILGIAYIDDLGNKINLMHKGTTKPGLYWLKNKMGNINGTFILKSGYYKGCWKTGTHKGYEALVQNENGIFKGWRDDNSDGKFDYNGETYSDVTGLNMHTESFIKKTERVGAYSAGCQVRADDLEHVLVMSILKKSTKLYGNKFSYALFEEREFI